MHWKAELELRPDHYQAKTRLIETQTMTRSVKSQTRFKLDQDPDRKRTQF